jgi:glucosyl-dolichyl phosphate glucuronosyltransferase
MKITVAVCTWNRATLLNQTLSAISRLVIPERVQLELLVVNNNCTDDTDEVIFRHSDILPIRRVFESSPGLSNARNAAVRSATGEYIVWTDDDVLVDKEWLAAYERSFRRWPESVFFGGPVRPWFEGVPPRWLSTSWKDVANAYAMRDLGLDPIDLDSQRKEPFGANFAVRLIEQRKYPYNPNLGRKLEGGTLGEETDVIGAMRESGLNGKWVPDAFVEHWIPRERQSLDYLKKYYSLYGKLLHDSDLVHERSFCGRPLWLWRKVVETRIAYYTMRLSGNPRRWIRPLIDSSTYWGMFEAERKS